jgi:CRP-like cAMP-binding protein
MHIERGRVWLAVTALSGKEAICGLLGAGAFLGEDALVGRVERRQSATAMIATEVLIIPKADMAQLLHSQSELMDRFISHLLARNTRLEADLTDQILYSSEQRPLTLCSRSPTAMRRVPATARCRGSLKRSWRRWSGRLAHESMVSWADSGRLASSKTTTASSM